LKTATLPNESVETDPIFSGFKWEVKKQHIFGNNVNITSDHFNKFYL